MELSTVPRPRVDEVSFGDQRRDAASELWLFDVAVPADLHQFGTSVRASALGNPANPPVVVLGGISANCFPAVCADGQPGWWSGLVGAGKSIDAQDFYVIGVDFAADDSGAAVPSTIDQARVLAAALDTVGVRHPMTIIGASYGGMVGLALAAAEPHRVAKLVMVCAADEPHPASTAARELQRRVVSLGLLAGRADEALAIARGMAMLTYRTADEFDKRFTGGIAEPSPLCCSEPGAYLRARGHAFRSVMSPARFLSLSASIDRHRVDVSKITAPCLLVGAGSDQLVFPCQLQRLFPRLPAGSELHLLESLYGHDMFLKEAERVGQVVAPFVAAS